MYMCCRHRLIYLYALKANEDMRKALHAKAVGQTIVTARWEKHQGARQVILAPNFFPRVPVIACCKIEPKAAGRYQLPKSKTERLGQAALEGTCGYPSMELMAISVMSVQQQYHIHRSPYGPPYQNLSL